MLYFWNGGRCFVCCLRRVRIEVCRGGLLLSGGVGNVCFRFDFVTCSRGTKGDGGKGG